MALLLIATEVVLPGWWAQFAGAVRAYQSYAADPSILQILLTAVGGEIAAGLVLVALVAACWRWRRATAESEAFACAIALTLSVTLAVLPKLASYNQLLLIPALAVLLPFRQRAWRLGRMARALYRGPFACLGWHWVAALVISVIWGLVPASRMPAMANLPIYTLFALPPATLLALAPRAMAVWRDI